MDLSTIGGFAWLRWSIWQGAQFGGQKWLAGDFNGDGRCDLAVVYSEGGSASIDVRLSTGSGFAVQRWASRQGGFWDAQNWMAGDFNGDGRADLAKAFNESKMGSVDVHLSNGSSCGIQRWARGRGDTGMDRSGSPATSMAMAGAMQQKHSATVVRRPSTFTCRPVAPSPCSAGSQVIAATT